MVIDSVTFQDGTGRKFAIQIGIEVDEKKLIAICDDILSHLWLDDDDEKPKNVKFNSSKM